MFEKKDSTPELTKFDLSRITEEPMCECVSACSTDLTTLVPLLMTCMSTIQVPFECEMRLTSENSAYEDTRQFH